MIRNLVHYRTGSLEIFGSGRHFIDRVHYRTGSLEMLTIKFE